MSVWYCIPSARPREEVEPVLRAWREHGYNIALQRDYISPGPNQMRPCLEATREFRKHYRAYAGYAEAVNFLVADILQIDPTCDWIVTGGDDILPDPNHSAEEIAAQCTEHFGGPLALYGHSRAQNTFGVMQPTGDRWADGSIDRICGSPWMGREFCLRINQGKGPLWPEYTHMFVDEELQNVALKLGIFWQRRDLVQKHNHYLRNDNFEKGVNWIASVPKHLKNKCGPSPEAQSHWDDSKAIFQRRRREGFPGHEPLVEEELGV